MTALEKLTNISMVVVSFAIIADISTRMLNRSGAIGRAAATAMPNTYQVGDAVNEIPNLTRARDRMSLMLVVRSTCPYCTMSMPFYERLVTEVRANGVQVQLNGVCTETTEICAQYLAKLGVDQVAGIPSGSLKIAGTPTLLLLTADGRVERVWQGKLTPDGERDVLEAVTRKAKS
jgi:hypothetical protein